MSVRDRVATLLAEMPKEPQYPSQGATLFVDLERQAVERAYPGARVLVMSALVPSVPVAA